MAAAVSLSLAGRITGEPGGDLRIGPLTFANAAANYTIQSVALANGANTITCPTAPAPNGVIIVLPTDNTALVTLKGISGDTGVTLGKTGWAVLTWDSANAPSSFVVNSASAQTGKYTQFIFF